MSWARTKNWPCNDRRMAGQIGLHAERNALEMKLLVLEQAMEDRQRCRVAAPDLADRLVSLLDRHGQVNARLAELRGPASPT
jgi:hypothetical protein